MFLELTEIPPESILRNIKKAVSGFSGPPRHHVIPQPQPLPRALWTQSLFLSAMMLRNLLCRLSTEDPLEFSDRLKPVFSSTPMVPAKPPLQGLLCLVPALVPRSPVSRRPPVKKVSFASVPATQLHRNPHRTVPGSLPLYAILCPHLLGGVTVATTKTTFRTSGPQQTW